MLHSGLRRAPHVFSKLFCMLDAFVHPCRDGSSDSGRGERKRGRTASYACCFTRGVLCPLLVHIRRSTTVVNLTRALISTNLIAHAPLTPTHPTHVSHACSLAVPDQVRAHNRCGCGVCHLGACCDSGVHAPGRTVHGPSLLVQSTRHEQVSP
jgi:hypothetical protein